MDHAYWFFFFFHFFYFFAPFPFEDSLFLFLPLSFNLSQPSPPHFLSSMQMFSSLCGSEERERGDWHQQSFLEQRAKRWKRSWIMQLEKWAGQGEGGMKVERGKDGQIDKKERGALYPPAATSPTGSRSPLFSSSILSFLTMLPSLHQTWLFIPCQFWSRDVCWCVVVRGWGTGVWHGDGLCLLLDACLWDCSVRVCVCVLFIQRMCLDVLQREQVQGVSEHALFEGGEGGDMGTGREGRGGREERWWGESGRKRERDCWVKIQGHYQIEKAGRHADRWMDGRTDR